VLILHSPQQSSPVIIINNHVEIIVTFVVATWPLLSADTIK